MTKKEKELQIQSNLYIFENPAEYNIESRITALEQVLIDSREYIDNYRVSAKHKFMGGTIGLNEAVLDELEILLAIAKQYKYEKIMEDKYLKATAIDLATMDDQEIEM